MRRLSFDIEVESVIGRIPDPKIAERTVTAIGFAGNDKMQKSVRFTHKRSRRGQKRLPDDVDVISA